MTSNLTVQVEAILFGGGRNKGAIKETYRYLGHL